MGLPASSFFFQTQHGMYVTSAGTPRTPAGPRSGYSITWASICTDLLGYGRCVAKGYTNDMYAVDYPLGKGDVII